MPALPADAVRATRFARIVTRTDTAIQTAFNGARDANSSPDVGYFDLAADATAVLDIKAALVGVFRRRFIVNVADEVWIDPLTAIPTYTLVDAETGANGACLLTRLEVDMETERSNMELVG